jgi:hypothetical protein
MLLASNVQDGERAAVAQRELLDQASAKIATEVTSLSDKAREYVITGDPVHLDIYQRDVTALRSVEERVRKIEGNFTPPEVLSMVPATLSFCPGLAVPIPTLPLA